MAQKKRPSKIEQEIDQNIKRAFDDIAEQELPSRFTDLLNQLRAQDAPDARGNGNDS
ncbi:MAG: NepR family anti-sigma factor [Pseudomonadota bacterium]